MSNWYRRYINWVDLVGEYQDNINTRMLNKCLMLGIKVDLNGTPGSMVWNMITVSHDADMDVQEWVS